MGKNGVPLGTRVRVKQLYHRGSVPTARLHDELLLSVDEAGLLHLQTGRVTGRHPSAPLLNQDRAKSLGSGVAGFLRLPGSRRCSRRAGWAAGTLHETKTDQGQQNGLDAGLHPQPSRNTAGTQA